MRTERIQKAYGKLRGKRAERERMTGAHTFHILQNNIWYFKKDVPFFVYLFFLCVALNMCGGFFSHLLYYAHFVRCSPPLVLVLLADFYPLTSLFYFVSFYFLLCAIIGVFFDNIHFIMCAFLTFFHYPPTSWIVHLRWNESPFQLALLLHYLQAFHLYTSLKH